MEFAEVLSMVEGAGLIALLLLLWKLEREERILLRNIIMKERQYEASVTRRLPVLSEEERAKYLAEMER